jgi:hypothetical protein
MTCHGVANSVETFHDGARLVIDFLVCDLEGEFDFLIGWDAIQHYKLQIDHTTGALTGTDFDGNRFTTMSQYQYTSVTSAIMAGDGEELGASAAAATRNGIRRQIAHLDTDDYAEQTQDLIRAAEDTYFEAVSESHEVLSKSTASAVQRVMSTEWADDSRFMEQLHPTHEVWTHDSSTIRTRDKLLDARANLIAATALRSYKVGATGFAKVAHTTASNGSDNDGWLTNATDTAYGFGQVVSNIALRSFTWARNALKWTNRLASTR